MRKILLTYIVMCSCLAACQKSPMSDYANNLNVGEISIESGIDVDTRVALWKTTFPIGSNVGIVIYRNDDNVQCSNVSRWTKYSSGWVASTPIELDDRKCTAYAYYPYDSTVSDITSIPVRYDMSDYMCAKSDRTDISGASGKNTISFVMKHIMTRVALRVRKDMSYIGAGKLTYVGIKNAPLKSVMPTDPSLISFNAKTGELTHAGTSPVDSGIELRNFDNTSIVYPITLNSNITQNLVGEMILAPFKFDSGDIMIHLVIDSVEYVVPVPKPSFPNLPDANGGWNTGHNYRYTLTLRPRNVAISAIYVNDWEEVN